MARVSVVVPAYNAETFIEEALESVFAQTYRDYEVILVNDGSTDGTERRLEKYFGRIKYLKQPNQGQSASRRNGLRESSGRFIAFLDADDVWLPHKLARQVEVAEAHPEYGIVTTDALSFEGDKVVSASLKAGRPVIAGYVFENLLLSGGLSWIPPSAAMVRRECFEKVSTFDVPPPCYGEDWMMWVQIAADYPVYFIDEVLVRRRVHSASMSSQPGEVQFQIVLRNLEILRERIPQLKARPDLFNEAAFGANFSRGLGDLRAVRLPQARERLRRAVGYKPHALKAWAALCAAYMPAGVLYGLKKLMGKGSRPSAASQGGSRK